MAGFREKYTPKVITFFSHSGNPPDFDNTDFYDNF